jgi:hypothetical protein
VQPPFVGTGYYDQKGRYVAVPPDAPAYVHSSSQGRDSSQELPYPRRENADNNTSRFGAMAPHINSSGSAQHHQQQM